MGREFDVTVLMEASEEGEQSVVSALEELSQRHLMRERSADVYDFAHDKFRDVVYRNLSLVRRRYLHLQAARALEKVIRGTGITAQLAHHYTEAGRIESAATYRIAAGNHALALSAYREAETHLRSGLELLDQLPPGPDRDEKELALLMGLGAALIPQKGFTAPEVGEVYGRAINVVRRLEDEPRLIPFLYSVGQFYTFRQQWTITRGLAERCLRLAQQTGKSDDLMFAHGLTGLAFAYSRHHTLSLKHLTQSLALYKHVQSNEARVNELNLICRAHAGLMLWILGYPDRSLSTLSEALNHARELAYTHSLAMLLTNLSIVYILRREPGPVQEFAEMAVRLCEEHDLPHWQALARISLGWAETFQGNHREGLAAINQGLALFDLLGTSVVAYTHTLLADIYLNSGNIMGGLQVVDHAIKAAQETRVETVLSMSLRIKGDLLGHANAPLAEVEDLYQQAIAFARAHHAKSFELQATLQLARFQQARGEGFAVRDTLARLHHWFNEGFDTPDLREAKAVLDAQP
jgi:tetratricopeptide (TPR) repeat protein